MRNICLMLAFAFLGFSYGQSYFIIKKQTGGNPGKLNTENDQTNDINGNWNKLLGSSSLPESKNTGIGFDFKFNDTNYSYLRIYSSGYISFDTSKKTALNGSSQNLPNAGIPKNSIVLWGVDLTGDNDKVITKTFGSAPNRQFWIKWQSASTYNCACLDANYFSIVLEETSNKIYVVSQNYFTTGTNNYVSPKHSLGIQFNNISAISFPYSPNLNNPVLSDLPNDNFYYEISNVAVPNTDAAVLTMNYGNKVKSNSNYQVKTMVANFGKKTIDSITLNYTVNNGSVKSAKLKNTNIILGNANTVNLEFPTSENTGAAGNWLNFKAWISNPNGTSESNKSNDTISWKLLVVNGIDTVSKIPLIEYLTSTTCETCPAIDDYIAYYKNVKANYAAYHYSDSMNFDKKTNFAKNNLQYFGYGMFNRKTQDIEKTNSNRFAINDTNNRLPREYTSVNISVDSIRYSGNVITGKITCTFRDYLPNNIKLGVIVTENNVRGNGNGWDQLLNYGIANNFESKYYSKRNPMVGVPHHNVVLGLPLSDFGKTVGAGKTHFSPGEKISVTFLYTGLYPKRGSIPSTAQFAPTGDIWQYGKPSETNIIGFVANYDSTFNDYSVLNSNSSLVWNLSNGTQTISKDLIRIFPNPAINEIYVDGLSNSKIHNIKIIDITGKANWVQNTNSNKINISGLTPGLYKIQITTDKKIFLGSFLKQ